MKKLIKNCRYLAMPPRALFAALALASLTIVTNSTRGDETCSSPYLPRIEGQEEFGYV